jgi:hypothetical protein
MKKVMPLLAACAICCMFTTISPAQRPGGNRQPGNIPIPQGPVKSDATVDLFASKNLSDWNYFLVDGVKKEEVFSFTDEGVLKCTVQPFGYLCTKEKYRDFKLTVQWRWPEGVEPTNSGVFLRMNGDSKGFLPRGVEAQLAHKSAGDLWAFHGMGLAGFDKARFTHNAPGNDVTGETRGTKKLVDAERDPGRWNTYEILCQGGTIVVSVNGTIVNWTQDVEDVEGPVGLQSEGGPIEFRNMWLTPLSRSE